MKALFQELCNSAGVSGYEDDIRAVIYNSLKDAKLDQIYTDSVGNLVCFSRGKASKRKIMITAHMDEVGFQVIKHYKDGYLIKPLGSLKTFDAVSTHVHSRINSGEIKSNEKDELSAYSYEKLRLFIEGTADTGEVFVFEPNFTETDDCYISKGLDNRAACYCLIKQILADHTHESDIYFVFTVQEEVGMRGSRVARTQIQPDILLNVDATPVLEMNSVSINRGVGIKISDGAVIANHDGVKELIKLATDNEIMYQLEVNDYGGNEMIITNELDNGCICMGLSIPCERMHSAHCKVGKVDLNACEELLMAYIRGN